MNEIKTIIASDMARKTKIGFDEFNQLVVLKWNDDHRVMEHGIGDPRGHQCLICGHGWESTVTSILDQYFLRDREAWVHEHCYINHLSLNHYYLFFGALVDARVRFTGLTTIPNEYKGAWNTDWFQTKLMDYDVTAKFGRRKRVYSIRFTGSNQYRFDAAQATILDDFFRKEQVTHESTEQTIMAHAWGDKKVYEYVKQICSTCQLTVRKEEANA